ncbi:MAG: hypothetical protein R3324_11130 [Halobacteriales archaeon]|nr:hypothetical protein [Halobacteriales archaeon]
MPSVQTLLTLAASLAVLVWASRLAVDRLVKLAQRFDVPDVLVAVTVISIGTSLPEIGTHLSASLGILAGELDYGVASATVLGGNLGSSIAQQLLLFGIFLLAYGRFTLTPTLRRDYYLPMLLAASLLLVVSFDGTIGRIDALVLLAAYVAHTYWSFEHRPRTMNVPDTASKNVPRDAVVSVAAMGVVLGAAFVALAAVEEVVADLALGGSMAGVVTIGLASALPELSTVLESVRRKAPNVAVGTLIGSNVVNPLVAVGLGGLVSTYRVPQAVVLWDLPFKLLAGVVFLAWIGRNGGLIRRRDGTALVIAYFCYVVGRLLVFPGQ